MTLYDLIMGGLHAFTKLDWAALGRGEVVEQETIKQMLMQGYEALATDDE